MIAFLADELSLDRFEDWLVQSSWDMHLDSPPAAVDLVAAIELPLSEYSSGHHDQSELRNQLRQISSYTVVSAELQADAIHVISGSRYATSRHPLWALNPLPV